MVAFLIFYWIFSALVICGRLIKDLEEENVPGWVFVTFITLSPVIFPFWIGYYFNKLD